MHIIGDKLVWEGVEVATLLPDLFPSQRANFEAALREGILPGTTLALIEHLRVAKREVNAALYDIDLVIDEMEKS